ncbi:cytosine permease [Carnobacterium sp. TMP28]|uniref:cytosine permease n=1 Tax=Carnobacterium sp. TMP28 TaxID=3397060 RepID=UPI0039E11946
MENTQQDKDYSLAKVQKEDKKGFWSMLFIMLGFTFFSASMLTGGTLGAGLSFRDFVIAVFIGNLILGIYTGFLAFISSGTGLSTHLLAKYSFGEKGSYLVSFLLGVTQVGWFGVGIAMIALPIHKVTGISIPVLVIIAGIAMTTSAFFGMKTLAIISFISVPAIALLGGKSVIDAIQSAGGMKEILSLTPTNPITMGTAISLTIGSFISGGSTTADFTRFAKSQKISVVTTVLAFFVGNSLMFLFGAVGAMVTGLSDVSEVMFSQGLIIPAIVVLGLNIWTTNDNAIYTAGLGFSNITKQPKKKIVLILGLLGTLSSLFLYNNFQVFLGSLGTFIPPVGGILIADYFLHDKERYKHFDTQEFRSVNVHALLATAIGSLAALYVPGIAAINGILVAIATYTVLVKVMKPSQVALKMESLTNEIS